MTDKAKRTECTELRLYELNREFHTLIACDVHGNGRSNKSWYGKVRGNDIDLPNMTAVKDFCHINGLQIERVWK